MIPAGQPHVVVIGGGFGGLGAARGLAKAPVRVTLLDKRNHHLFQPLLYQVAMAALSPAQIAAPIREVLGRQKNCAVLLAEAVAIDTGRRVVKLREGGAVAYDYLILAAGATHSYFGHAEWEAAAPGLKTVEDALEIRRRFLLSFERAELTEDAAERDALLTFVVVGAGPTGVETSGAMMEIALRTMPQDFRRIDTRRARVILVEAQDRVLAGGFPPELSAKALAALRRMGVDVRLNTRVTAIDRDGVTLMHEDGGGGSRIASRNVIWAAGVAASPVAASLGVPLDRSGRVIVQPDLSIAGHPEVLVIGDLAHVIDVKTSQPVPGMAPGAMQMGRYAAKAIRAAVGGKAESERKPFVYTDKGSLATIGRAKAVAHVWGRNFGGWPAWMLWAFVHIIYLIGFRAKVLVLMEWVWAYVFFRRGARLITGADRKH